MREGKERRKGEKHQCVVASHAPRSRDLACNPLICPDWELNWRPFGLQAHAQSTEPHQARHFPFTSVKPYWFSLPLTVVESSCHTFFFNVTWNLSKQNLARGTRKIQFCSMSCLYFLTIIFVLLLSLKPTSITPYFNLTILPESPVSVTDDFHVANFSGLVVNLFAGGLSLAFDRGWLPPAWNTLYLFFRTLCPPGFPATALLTLSQSDKDCWFPISWLLNTGVPHS